MVLDRIWKDEASRAVEVLGGEPVKYKREVEDKLVIKFPMDEWCRLFNVEEGYVPCDPDGKEYQNTRPMHIHFVRRVKDERT